MALLLSSPAIDVDNSIGCTDGQGHLPKSDQCGMPLPNQEDSGGCKMGAFEEQDDNCIAQVCYGPGRINNLLKDYR
jgi:hypothetical protein